TTTTFDNVPDANAHQGVLPTGTIAVSPKIAPYLPYFPLPSPQGRNFGDGTAQYIFPAALPLSEDFGQARIDHQFSSNDSLFGRFTGSNSGELIVAGYPTYHTSQFLNS